MDSESIGGIGQVQGGCPPERKGRYAMGLRAYVIKKYDVQYGEMSGFNYGADFLGRLIGEYCECAYLGGDYNDYDAIWEVDKGEFANMVAELEKLTDEEFNEKAEKWGADGDDDYTKSYVIELFKDWLAETPENETWVRFGWL